MIKKWNHEKISEAWNHMLIVKVRTTGNVKECKSLGGIMLLSGSGEDIRQNFIGRIKKALKEDDVGKSCYSEGR